MRVGKGKELSSKLTRAGRSMNSSVFFITQQCDDLAESDVKKT